MSSPHNMVLERIADMLREDIDELDARNCFVSFRSEPPDEREYATCLMIRHLSSEVAGQNGGLFMDRIFVEMSLFTRAYTDDRGETSVQFGVHSDILWRCIKRLIHHYLYGILADPLQVIGWRGPRVERDNWLSSVITWRGMYGVTTSDMMDEAKRER